jgi:hypothetical protein
MVEAQTFNTTVVYILNLMRRTSHYHLRDMASKLACCATHRRYVRDQTRILLTSTFALLHLI